MAETAKVKESGKSNSVAVHLEKIAARDAFDNGQLMAVIESYAADKSIDPTISIALKAHHPLVDKEHITIFADNQLQIDKLNGVKMHFQNILMRQLNNGFLSVEFRLFEADVAHEEKKLYTASEKFEHFLSLNPVVADLKRVFGLEID